MGTPSLSNLPFSRSTFFQVRGRTGHVAVLVPSGHQDRSALPLRSVLGVCHWQTAPEASRPFAARQGGYRKQERDSQAAGQGRGLGHSRHKKRTAQRGGPSSMQGRLIGRYKRPAASLPGRRGFPGRRGWSGSQRSGGRRTCTPAHRQCPRPKSAPRPYRRPFGPFPAG